MPLTYIQIGSWNIKHLGRQPTSHEQSQSVFALTDHIEMAGIDVLALQEIYVTSSSGMRNEHLDRTCELLKEHTEQDWDYVILPNRDKTDTSQLCGFFWNTTVVDQVGAWEVPVKTKVGSDWLWDRKPHAVKFRTKHDIRGKQRSFVAVPLHMKANGKDKRAKKKRALEATELAAQVPWIIQQTEDESLILLGDANILGSWEKAVEIFEDAGFDDLNSEDAPTYAGSRAPFDRIFVRSDRDEFQFSRQYVIRSANETAHLDYLSDHYLVKTSMKVFKDGD